MLAAMPLPPTTAPPGDETPVRGRDDACPGALRLHPADDGALARVRVPGGLLTARQALVLAGVAEELGDGRLDLTSRGNLQLRGLDAGCGAGLAARLRAAGLLPSDRHDRVRNIVASPLSGLDGAGHADAPAWARALDALLCDEVPAGSGFAELAGLSGRFLFALDDGRGDVSALGADVTLIATPDGEAVLRLGSAWGHGLARADSTAPNAADSPDATDRPDATDHSGAPGVAARRAGRAAGDDTPSRARPPGPPGLGDGPSGAELLVRAEDAPRAAALAAVAFLDAVRASGTRAWRVRELPARHAVTADRLAGRLAAAGIQATPLGPQSPTTTAGTPAADPTPAVGLVVGPDGRCAVSVAVPLGRLSAAQWRLSAGLASRRGSGELRVTPWRGVVLPGFSPDEARAALRELADAGLVATPHSPWLGIAACTGRPGCAKSLADVRADAARAVAGAVAGAASGDGRPDPPPDQGPPPGRPPVYFSGCERRCGHPGGRWVDVLATGDGYRVAVRDPGGSTPGVDVTADQLAGAVASARGAT
ncbi:nitrite reductase [Streptomyces sp. NPDC059590]|uniref:nitrite reductase n=1 Tax=Streptomyces sp. NPDC059590 TaxID=3346877 RepID=UPI0036CA5BE9